MIEKITGAEVIEKADRIRAYFQAHPEEDPHANHMIIIKTGSDAFLMEKVEKWEKAKGVGADNDR